MKKQELNVNEIYTINGVNYRLNEDLELIELTKNIYDLQNGNVYYCIVNTKDIDNDKWLSYSIDKQRLELGNVFLTEKDARFELERRKTIAKIKKWKHDNDNDYKFICGKRNYYILFNLSNNVFYIDCHGADKIVPSWLYFSNECKALECLEFIGEENWKKYVLDIEE